MATMVERIRLRAPQLIVGNAIVLDAFPAVLDDECWFCAKPLPGAEGKVRPTPIGSSIEQRFSLYCDPCFEKEFSASGTSQMDSL